MELRTVTTKQEKLINDLNKLGVKITKITTSEINSSDNLIIPTKDRKGMLKMKLKDKSKNFN